MYTLKSLEIELVLDWQKAQRIHVPDLKEAALKAYYAKYALYRRIRAWKLELLTVY